MPHGDSGEPRFFPPDLKPDPGHHRKLRGGFTGFFSGGSAFLPPPRRGPLPGHTPELAVPGLGDLPVLPGELGVSGRLPDKVDDLPLESRWKALEIVQRQSIHLGGDFHVAFLVSRNWDHLARFP